MIAGMRRWWRNSRARLESIALVSRVTTYADAQGEIVRETAAADTYNRLGSLWWFHLFTLPGSLFSTNPTFNGLARHASEWGWASVYLVGVLLTIAPRRFCSPLFRLAALAWMSGVWAATAICLCFAAPHDHLGPFRHHGPVILDAMRYLNYLRITQTPINTGVGIYGALAYANASVARKLGIWVVLDMQSARPLLARLGKARRKGGATSG